MYKQESLFSKAYHPLAQQYFSAGPLPPPLLHPLLGGSISMFTSRGPLPYSLLGGPLLCSLLGGVHFHVHFQGSTSVFTSGGSTSMFTSGGSHVTYPIMLLYTAIECPSASWAKFTWDPPPPNKELDRLTDRQTLVKTLPSCTTWRAVIMFTNIYFYGFGRFAYRCREMSLFILELIGIS